MKKVEQKKKTHSENKRLKVLFLPSWYPSERNPVAGVFIREHAKAVALYNEVIVIYNEGKYDKIKGGFSEISDEIEEDIRTIRIKHKKLFIPKISFLIISFLINLFVMITILNKLVKEGWKPDVIHAHVFGAGVVAAILGKIYDIPVVITEHWSGFSCRTLKKIDIVKARFAMNNARIILPVSKDLERAIKSYGIKNNFQIIPNVVNTAFFYPSKHRIRHNKKRILLAAILSPPKGIPYLLKALSKLQETRTDFILDIVGDGPNRKEYESLTKKLGIQKFVQFRGFKTKEELASLMKQSDFMVQPSLYETFGVVYIEAMACGKPIVATQLPVLREKITKERGFLVPTKDINALAKAIDYMLDHYQDYDAEKISKYVKSNFSYEVIGKKLDNIYKRLIK